MELLNHLTFLCLHDVTIKWDLDVASFYATDVVINCGNEELQLSEIFPDTMIFKFDSPLLAVTDCVTEANSVKQICPKIEEADNAMIIGMWERELSFPASTIVVENNCCKILVSEFFWIIK